MSYETDMDLLEMEIGSELRYHIDHNKEDQVGVLILSKRDIDIIQEAGMINVRNDDLAIFDVNFYKKNDPTCTECGNDCEEIYKHGEPIGKWLDDNRNKKEYLNDLFNPVDELCEICILHRLHMGFDPTYLKAIREDSWEALALACYGIVLNHETTREEGLKEANIKMPTKRQLNSLKDNDRDAEYYALDLNLNPNGNLVDLRHVYKTMFYFKKGKYNKPFIYEEVR